MSKEEKKVKGKLHQQVHLMNSFFSQVTTITGIPLNQSAKIKLFNLAQMVVKLPNNIINLCDYRNGAFLVKKTINEA